MFHFRKKLLKRHRIMVWVIVISVSLFGLATFLQNKLTAEQVQTQYLKLSEKKYWSQLEIFHNGQLAISKSYFARGIDTVSNLASRPEITEAIIKGNTSFLTDVLARQRETNKVVNGLYILNRDGVLVAQNSEGNTFAQRVGSSFSDRDYFQEALRTKAPGTSNVLLSRNNKYGITFCSPFLKESEVQAVLCGAVSLSTLAGHLNDAELETEYVDFTAVITDSDGNVLYENHQELTEQKNIKDDRAVAALMSGLDKYKSDEINYQNEDVFAVAERVATGPNSNIFIVNYLPKSEIAKDQALLQNALDRANAANGFRTIVLTLIACFLMSWIIKKHDEETS